MKPILDSEMQAALNAALSGAFRMPDVAHKKFPTVSEAMAAVAAEERNAYQQYRAEQIQAAAIYAVCEGGSGAKLYGGNNSSAVINAAPPVPPSPAFFVRQRFAELRDGWKWSAVRCAVRPPLRLKWLHERITNSSLTVEIPKRFYDPAASYGSRSGDFIEPDRIARTFALIGEWIDWWSKAQAGQERHREEMLRQSSKAVCQLQTAIAFSPKANP